MRKRIKGRIKGTANALFIGSAACMCIYGTLVICAAKSILKMQNNPVDY